MSDSEIVETETTTVGDGRAEHLSWCKTRALEYVDSGDVLLAFHSMVRDLGQHSTTKGHTAIGLGVMLILSGHLSTAVKMRKFIEGFN